MADSMPYFVARFRESMKSKAWNCENGLILQLHPISKKEDKALCIICRAELSANVGNGTSRLLRHANKTCPQAAGARPVVCWTVPDAAAVLQSKDPQAVHGVQWRRQGGDVMLLLRQRPWNMEALDEKGFQVLLLPELLLETQPPLSHHQLHSSTTPSAGEYNNVVPQGLIQDVMNHDQQAVNHSPFSINSCHIQSTTSPQPPPPDVLAASEHMRSQHEAANDILHMARDYIYEHLPDDRALYTPLRHQLNDAPAGDLNEDPAIFDMDFEGDPDTAVRVHVQGFNS